jgi:hypothetical protein
VSETTNRALPATIRWRAAYGNARSRVVEVASIALLSRVAEHRDGERRVLPARQRCIAGPVAAKTAAAARTPGSRPELSGSGEPAKAAM